MRIRQYTQTGTGILPTSKGFPLSPAADYFQLAWNVTVTGTVTFNIEHCQDPILDPTFTGTPTWSSLTGNTGLTATTDGSYNFPISAIRCNVTAGTGTVVFKIVPNAPN